MELDNFILEEYNKKNIDHKSTIITLNNDEDVNTYIGDLELSLLSLELNNTDFDKAYIVYYKGYENPVGLICTTLFPKHNKYEIFYGILPEFRRQNLATLLLREFSKKIYEIYPEIEELTLQINQTNEASRKVAEAVGYKIQNKTEFTLKKKYNNT